MYWIIWERCYLQLKQQAWCYHPNLNSFLNPSCGHQELNYGSSFQIWTAFWNPLRTPCCEASLMHPGSALLKRMSASQVHVPWYFLSPSNLSHVQLEILFPCILNCWSLDLPVMLLWQKGLDMFAWSCFGSTIFESHPLHNQQSPDITKYSTKQQVIKNQVRRAPKNQIRKNKFMSVFIL